MRGADAAFSGCSKRLGAFSRGELAISCVIHETAGTGVVRSLSVEIKRTEQTKCPFPSPVYVIPSSFRTLHTSRKLFDENLGGLYSNLSLPQEVEKLSEVKAEKRPEPIAVARKLIIKGSPYKLNDVAKLIRGMQIDQAVRELTFCSRRVGRTIVKKVVEAARANAMHNQKMDPKRTYVAEAFVGKSMYLKRIYYHARGRSGVKHRPFSRITVILKHKPLPEEVKATVEAKKTKRLKKLAALALSRPALPICQYATF